MFFATVFRHRMSYLLWLFLQQQSRISCIFYHVTASMATNSIAVTILSVRLSDACIVSKLNDALWIFRYHTKEQSF